MYNAFPFKHRGTAQVRTISRLSLQPQRFPSNINFYMISIVCDCEALCRFTTKPFKHRGTAQVRTISRLSLQPQRFPSNINFYMISIVCDCEALCRFTTKITEHLHIFVARKNTFCEEFPGIISGRKSTTVSMESVRIETCEPSDGT